jgi:diadenosine tetraphosphate (Ap4A) HIT family hydrolase
VTCAFCAIRDREQPASLVHEDERSLALMDIYPINEGHVIVVPREHAANLGELDPDTGAHLFRVAQQAAARLRASGIRREGVNLVLSDGEAAGQDVFHVHLHVLPRFADDNFAVSVPSGVGEPPRSRLDELAALLRF